MAKRKKTVAKDLFSVNFARLAKRHKLTQKELSVRMNTGQGFISALMSVDESKRKTPSMDTLQVAADAIGCEVADFFVKPR